MSKNIELTMIDESSLNAIRRIVAEEIHRYAEEVAAAQAARPKARAELTAEEAARYMTVDEVAAVTGYGVPSLRSMASKKMKPEAFPILPIKFGVRSLYDRAEVMASPKAQEFINGATGFIATPKEPLPPTQIIEQPSVTSTGAAIQNAINAAKPAAKKAPALKSAPAAKKTPAKKVAPAAKRVAAKRKA
ncbi:hypothetical protein [Caballeronia cordobensis]|uniref:hypothetical protein n=1 Tax=Caballeronia cordobensis TaxID=1353886 RepID=UPI00045EFE09|nr:hypothetical protein BRPE67_BCDS10930 [Burkholderia sp. RPE67]